MAGDKVKHYGKVSVKVTRPLGVQEASGLAPAAHGAFFVVDDERGVFHCAPDGDLINIDVGEGLTDLESIAITPDGKHALVLAEHDGGIWRFSVEDDDLRDGERLGSLPRLSGKKNQGWEGIAFAAAGTVAEHMELVAVHQVKPRRIGLFDAQTLKQRSLLRLPKNARKAIGELNDVAMDAGGRILLLSGKSGRIAEMRLEDEALSLVRVYRIESSEDDVPEGICIDAEGRVWLCTDGKGILYQLELEA